jgi:hypothetical protein
MGQIELCANFFMPKQDPKPSEVVHHDLVLVLYGLFETKLDLFQVSCATAGVWTSEVVHLAVKEG